MSETRKWLKESKSFPINIEIYNKEFCVTVVRDPYSNWMEIKIKESPRGTENKILREISIERNIDPSEDLARIIKSVIFDRFFNDHYGFITLSSKDFE